MMAVQEACPGPAMGAPVAKHGGRRGGAGELHHPRQPVEQLQHLMGGGEEGGEKARWQRQRKGRGRSKPIGGRVQYQNDGERANDRGPRNTGGLGGGVVPLPLE